jgi:hypothetical protein
MTEARPVRASRRRGPRPIVVALAVVLVAEVALRLIGPHLPPNQVWAAAEDQVKVDQMKALAKAGVRGGVVIVGTSLTDVGVDPVQLTKLAGLRVPAYDASLAGGDLAVVAWWTTHVVIPTLHPRVVVLGISSREFNPNDRQAVLLGQQFFAAPAVHHLDGNESVFETLERKVDDWSYLFRYRKVVRVPTNLTGGHNDIALDRKFQTPQGMQLAFVSSVYTQGPVMDQFFTSTVTTRYQVGQPQLDALQSLLAALRHDGITVALVDMPVTDHYIALHPHGQADYDAYRQAVGGVVGDSGVWTFPGQVWDPKLFADPIHLNGTGAEQFTNQLAVDLKPLLPPAS